MKAELQYSENGMVVTGIRLEGESTQEKRILIALNMRDLRTGFDPSETESWFLLLELTSAPMVAIPRPVPSAPVSLSEPEGEELVDASRFTKPRR